MNPYRNNQPITLNCRGRVLDISTPVAMGIINLSPDSFYSDSRVSLMDDIVRLAKKHLEAGAAILDIGALSTRPGAKEIPAEQEIDMLLPAIQLIQSHFPEAILSADVYRSEVARQVLEAGVHIINDIGGGQFDAMMWQTVGKFDAPYILMHNRSKSLVMNQDTDYENLIQEMIHYFYQYEHRAAEAGIKDILLDPGIGFSKTRQHNFEILRRLNEFRVLARPILVGLSRKSFIYNTLHVDVKEALNGTTVLHMKALSEGASLLRVHDVKEAVECITLYTNCEQSGSNAK